MSNTEVPAFKSDKIIPSLTDEEFEHANKEMNDKSFLKFPKVDRKYRDPLYRDQKYSLHSFLPAKGATPDENGMYGVIKFRGVFATEDEANDRSKYLIKNVDSYNPIITGYVGLPMPLVDDHRKFCSETDEVDLKKQNTENIMDEDLKEKRKEDKKIIKEIKEKEQKLLDDVKEDKEVDPEEEYTMLRVKRSQLIFTYNQSLKKMKQMVTSLEKTEEEIKRMDAEDESYKNDYMERYLSARNEVGLDESSENFMIYLARLEPFQELLDKIE